MQNRHAVDSGVPSDGMFSLSDIVSRCIHDIFSLTHTQKKVEGLGYLLGALFNLQQYNMWGAQEAPYRPGVLDYFTWWFQEGDHAISCSILFEYLSLKF